MKLITKSAFKMIAIIGIFIIILGVFLYQFIWIIYLKEFPREIKPHLEIISKAYYLSKITGSYWENEMEIQAKNISKLPQDMRVAFFQGVLLITCDLDTSRATSFVQVVGKDAEALRNNLINLKKHDRFPKLSQKQKEIVSDWINELEIILIQQKFDN